MTTVLRPIVRQFKQRYSREAGRHVRAGGHAVVWDGEGARERALLVIPIPDDDDPMDLGHWSMLDIGKNRWQLAKEGPLKGLATARVPRDCHDIVKRRAERDAGWPGTKRRVTMDCLACGACCRDNRVVLEDSDVERFEAAGRHDLFRRPYARKEEDGTIVLRLLRSKDCRHLAGDNKCGIYHLRPSACSEFPVASECCLYAREEELGIYDGLPPS